MNEASLDPRPLMKTMTASKTSNSTDQTPLQYIRSLVHAEKSLTLALTTTKPLLNRPCSSILNDNSTPLLPLPLKSQVDTILALASTYSTRTSAPPNWNSNLPVVGFATPNPLPHQLRGGALGGMQLKLARQELRAKELARVEREKRKQQQEIVKDVEEVQEVDMAEKRKREDDEPAKATSAKKNEMIERQKRQSEQVILDKSTSVNKEVVDMNLSDSSSDESDDD